MAAGGREPSLWDRVCAEYEAEQPQFPDGPESKQEFVSLEAGIAQPLRVEQFCSAPAADTSVQQLLSTPETAPIPEPPDPKTCPPREYLEYYIFPVLLPGMAELLHRAQEEKCFERKRTKFIACDFLTEWLYNNNPKRKDESFTEFFSIPFVKDWLKDHPRRPIPLSLILSEEAASIIIQSFWRGYRVRCDSEVQELRQWQKKLREEKNIVKIVKEFWTKQEAKASRQMDFLHLISFDAVREHLNTNIHCCICAIAPKTHQKIPESTYSCFQDGQTAFGNVWMSSDFPPPLIILPAFFQRWYFEHWTLRMMGQKEELSLLKLQEHFALMFKSETTRWKASPRPSKRDVSVRRAVKGRIPASPQNIGKIFIDTDRFRHWGEEAAAEANAASQSSTQGELSTSRIQGQTQMRDSQSTFCLKPHQMDMAKLGREPEILYLERLFLLSTSIT
ncbi:IQ domain-containing protein K [Strigops habroptila]|uniref:IQ domain-containing protein K n=1 Tax=Strigops habroptila TaxID=2489341 RepID=UPI0011CF9A39|nr:IQ domain-containing protein K [Strigops habroptila]